MFSLIILPIIAYLVIMLSIIKGAGIMRARQVRTLYLTHGDAAWDYSKKALENREFWQFVAYTAPIWPAQLVYVFFRFLCLAGQNLFHSVYRAETSNRPQNHAERLALAAAYHQAQSELESVRGGRDSFLIRDIENKLSSLRALGAEEILELSS